MNKCKLHELESETMHELKSYGFHIENPPPRKEYYQGQLLSFDNQPCELLELVEVSEYRELWLARFFDSPEPSFILL